ncbi:alr0857 family protein [Phormidesmis sp. 146-35]
MLKLTYTEAGLHFERVVSTSLEVLVAQRVILALRAGQPLHIEPGKASFLMPIETPELRYLGKVLKMEASESIVVTAIDHNYVEISLTGSWLAESAEAHAGMLVTTFSEQAEFLVYKLWQATQSPVSFLA